MEKKPKQQSESTPENAPKERIHSWVWDGNRMVIDSTWDGNKWVENKKTNRK